MTDKAEPQVAKVSVHSAQKKALGAFQYANYGETHSKLQLIAGVAGTLLCVVILAIRGTPVESNLEEGSGFSIPGLGQGTDSANSPGKYNRTQEAKDIDDKRKAKGKSPRTQERLIGPKLIARPGSGKIPPGTLVKATLVSGASNGLVKAALMEAITLDGETLALSGSVVIGQGSSTDDRLYIHFNKMITREGQSISISAEAADTSDRIAGLKGSKIGGKALSLAAGIGLNFLGGVSEGLEDSHGEQGVAIKRASMKNAFLHGAARASVDESHELLNEAKNAKPALSVGSGEAIYLLFSDDGG